MKQIFSHSELELNKKIVMLIKEDKKEESDGSRYIHRILITEKESDIVMTPGNITYNCEMLLGSTKSKTELHSINISMFDCYMYDIDEPLLPEHKMIMLEEKMTVVKPNGN